MNLDNVKLALGYAGGALRCAAPLPNLVEKGDVYALQVKQQIPELSRYFLVRLCAAAVLMAYYGSDTTGGWIDGSEYKRFGPLIVRFQSLGARGIAGTDAYVRSLRKSPHIVLHLPTTHRELDMLPSALGRLAEFLQANDIAREYPYVLGVTNSDMARLAVAHGMRLYTASDQEQYYQQMQQLDDARRRARGKSPEPLEWCAVSLPTEEFIACARRVAERGLKRSKKSRQN